MVIVISIGADSAERDIFGAGRTCSRCVFCDAYVMAVGPKGVAFWRVFVTHGHVAMVRNPGVA